ncbi:MAG TPA: hypothetical protein VHG10_14615 [Glycomyces sp.]|nr:hypothetical protein [Glycomyces sp.]
MATLEPASDAGHEPGTGTSPAASDTAVDEAARPQPDDHDRWRRFAAGDAGVPAAETAPPGRWRRFGRALARGARSEWTFAGLFSILLAVAMTWPLVKDLDDVIPHDIGDPLLQAYTLGWIAHALRGDLGAIWDTNSFWPLTDAYLYTDTLLGYAPAAAFATDTASTIVVYNVLYIGTFALAFLGAYALLRQLGARVAGSAVGAAAFAYAPWKLAHLGHLNILSTGGIVLALAMLARGHGWSLRGGLRPERQRWGWVLAGWCCALWQFSIGVALGLVFVYLLLAIAVVVGLFWLIKRPRLHWRTLVADGVGGTAFALGVLWIADRHAMVARLHPETVRDLDYVAWFSPTWQSFIIAPEESRLWGQAHEAARIDLTWPPEQTLLVGFTLLALAFSGLVWSVWTGWQRWWMALGTGVLMALAMGPNFLDDGAWAWQLLYDYAPGFDAIRTPGRLVLYMTLLLVILAAGTLTRIADEADDVAHRARIDKRLKVKAPRRVHALLFLPIGLVLWEGLTVGPYVPVPDAPVDMSELEGPVLFLPAGGGDAKIQYWSIDGFPEIANGVAAFTPSEQEGIRSLSQGFPSDEAIEGLRGAGIATVVVLPDSLPGTDWSGMDTEFDPMGVEVERTETAVVYDLNAD